ncbi:MAG: mechanosensitive ion channel [Clostridia bacterium]|nr:mechanosensitive ion channel [Clostridia bacterium]
MILMKLDLAQLIKKNDFEGIKALIISKIPLIIGALIMILIGFRIANLIGNIAVKAMKAKGVDESIHSFIRTIIVLILKIIVILSAISTLGININSIIAALGATGIAAGLGLQESVSQFASGISILINKPFKSGDYVELENVSGKVKEIKLMYTTLITLDNKQIIVPNSHITSNNLINYTSQSKRRLDLVYSISYNTDIAKAKQVLYEVVNNYELVLKNPEPIIAVKEHASNSINIACYVWCNSTDYWDVFYYMQEQVKIAFDSNGVSIPFEQLDLHISNDNSLNDILSK